MRPVMEWDRYTGDEWKRSMEVEVDKSRLNRGKEVEHWYQIGYTISASHASV